jgi:hypothetical protein
MEPTTKVDPSRGEVVVIRSVDTAPDFLRRYAIQVDGKVAANIRLGDVFKLEVRPGKHTISAKISDNQSSDLEFNAVAGQTVTVTIEPTPGSNALRRAGQWLTLVSDPSRE